MKASFTVLLTALVCFVAVGMVQADNCSVEPTELKSEWTLPSAPADDSPRSESLRRLVARADSGVSQARYALSALLEQGAEGFQQDLPLALHLLRSAAEQDYAPACNYLGYSFLSGKLGLEQNPDSALYWIERGASLPQPDPKAWSNLGILLMSGSGGVKQDYTKAAYWLDKAASAGVPAAQESLGWLYLEGKGVPTDTIKAEQLLTQAASSGLISAGQQLWILMRDKAETLTPSDAAALGAEYLSKDIYPVALPLLQQASDAGDSYATAILAQCYATARGVKYDYSKAIALFLDAAHNGDPSAQYVIAETLESFPDLSGTDDVTAEEWRARAASAGITDSTMAIRRLTP